MRKFAIMLVLTAAASAGAQQPALSPLQQYLYNESGYAPPLQQPAPQSAPMPPPVQMAAPPVQYSPPPVQYAPTPMYQPVPDDDVYNDGASGDIGPSAESPGLRALMTSSGF